MAIAHARVTAPSAQVAWRTLLLGAALFGLFGAMLAYVQFGTPALADNDGYYHMKMGWLMRQHGLAPEFIWLPLSILSPERFYNHHMLYQAYLGLFAGDGSPQALIIGAKLASVAMPALAFTAIWWLLRGQQVPWAALWALGLCAISEAFLYRMSQPRAQSAALLVLALSLHAMLQRRYWRLLPLGFLFVWLYNAFPLLLTMAAIYAIAAWLTERELAWRPVAYAGIGVALGLLVNPYFPQNIAFILSHIAPKLSDPTATAVGNEWYPYRTLTLLENSGGALAAWVAGIFAIGWQGRRLSRAQLTAFALSLLFGYMLLQSRRFIEYFPPFALIFAALAIGPLLRGWLGSGDQPPTTNDHAQTSSSPGPWPLVLRPSSFVLKSRPSALALLSLAFCLLPLTLQTLPAARELMASSRPAETYAGASAWLRANTAPGSMVFQTDWDDFPRLFFYNTDSRYTAGLDPTYLQLYDPDLYTLWVDLTRGEVATPGAIISKRFGAQYAITDLRHTAFLREAGADPSMREVYRDEYAVIYTID